MSYPQTSHRLPYLRFPENGVSLEVYINPVVLKLNVEVPDGEELRKAISKEFKLNGVMVNDPEVIRNIAGDFEGYSEIVQLYNGKEGIKSGTRGEERLLTEDEFADLRSAVSDEVAKKVAELLKGKTDIFPMKTAKKSACTYCRFKGICRFDTVFEGNKWNPVE